VVAKRWGFAVVIGAALGSAIALAPAQTTLTFDSPVPPSLKTIPVPEPTKLYDFVADKAAAIRLGKALFWDMQVGSDGIVACATCHFHAGADHRRVNQINPGTRAVDANGNKAPDHTFSFGAGANHHLTPDMFPLRQLWDQTDRGSTVLVRESNDVVSSQGVFSGTFNGATLTSGLPIENITPTADRDGFTAGGPALNVRRVEPRNTPSVINAVFNHRNFWDGRAKPDFNGVNQLGSLDTSARVAKIVNKQLTLVPVSLNNASLASQAVAPIVNSMEMSADGRTGPNLGNKLGRKKGAKLSVLRPLGFQRVDRTDSVLGSLSRYPDPGLKVDSYATMIQAAFRSEWWQSTQFVSVASNGTTTIVNTADKDSTTDEYAQIEYNFPLFFGIAVQLYEAYISIQ